MTHILPPHTDLNLAPSSLQSALVMGQDQQEQQQQTQQQQQQQQQQQPQQQSSRKRKKNDSNNDESATSPAEPRRLRRSHEACARCRSKKIKCDSKHPRCTACATAGTPCHQEDRHRQTLTPRGYTERIERQLAQCDALLKRQIPGFDLSNLEELLARDGIDIDATNPPVSAAFQFAQPSTSPPKGFPYPPHQHMVPPGYPIPLPYGAPPGAPYPPHMQMQGPPPPGAFNPHIHPVFQHPHPMHPPPPPVQAHPPSANDDIPGQDPKLNDMTDPRALAKTFGVSEAIVNDLPIGTSVVDEDLAVGSGGLTSGRDRDINEAALPRDVSRWISIQMRRNGSSPPHISQSTGPVTSALSPISVWLPKDKNMVKSIVDVYFTRLNIHRPVFSHAEFERTLDGLYDGQGIQHDPGYICSLYLILALGTLSELNHRASAADKDRAIQTNPVASKKLLPRDWPDHEEFFERALSVKPDLRVTVSSLQALILLQWYLYTERQGRTLWRLVGSLVRLSIELGLHHDPTAQENTFTEEECQLRIRLWGIVMVHDRGTSILLGRPLAIAPSDSNTPRPSRGKGEFSEHFLLSHHIAEIQADIINSLYTPTRQNTDAIMRHASRIIKSMVEFRRQLPESYKWYFSGTEDWPLDKRSKLVQDITEDQGLTLLKIGIARILLLRALFSSRELHYAHRYKALVDAIVTSHNIIVVHYQLIRFPDIAFFVSPIPLHIAAMVILYGHMSYCDRLPRDNAVEDVWMALDMLPRLRWRWERKDLNGGHPLITKLAERVLGVTNLKQVGPVKNAMLLSEQDWDSDTSGLLSPSLSVQSKSKQTTPNLAHTPFSPGGPVAYGPQPRATVSSTASPMKSLNGPQPIESKHLVDVPTGLFYPFFPENAGFNVERMSGTHVPGVTAENINGGNGSGNAASTQDYSHLLAAAAAQPDGTYGCQPSQDSFMLEERDASASRTNPSMWMTDQRGVPYAMPTS